MKIKSLLLAISLSLMVFLQLQAPMQAYGEGVELGDAVVITAKVVHVDYVDRELGLIGPNGKLVYVEVGKEARNFNQIEVGDLVKVTYYESVALFIGKGGGKPDVAADVVTGRSAKGELPAGFEMETVDVAAVVKAIDMKNRTVTLEMPDGKSLAKKVDKSVQAFDTLAVGDSINVRYTEAIAISVEKP